MIPCQKLALNFLLRSNRYSFYIHLKDHDKKINPDKNKVPFSYMNPNKLTQNAPQQHSFEFQLKRKTLKQLERKMFEQYKMKVLEGQIDQQEDVQIDPLWGEEDKPVHYFQNLSKNQLMKVSYPQSQEFQWLLKQIYIQNTKASVDNKNISIQQVTRLSPQELLEAALSARQTDNQDFAFWHYLEVAFGNRFYQLSNLQLIQLLYCCRQPVRRGSPRFNNILKDLIQAEIPNLTKNQLKFLHYSLRHSRTSGVCMQQKVEKQLQKYYAQMSVKEKIDWIFSYTMSIKAQGYQKSHEKIVSEKRIRAHDLLFKLNLGTEIKQSLNIQICEKLVYSFAKLRVKNTKFITVDIADYLKENISELENNIEASYKFLFYLQQIEGGEGLYDQELFGKLTKILTSADNFGSLNKYQQIKTIYAIWNYNLMTQQVMELYQSIQIQGDSTLLNYICQIQMSHSSERQWQVLKCMAELQAITLPHYQSFKRFYNYMKATTEWDLTPIKQKLANTEHYFDVMRFKDSLQEVSSFKDIGKYIEFSNQPCPFQYLSPIQNVELCQYAISKYQVSVDVVTEKALVPGTNTLKQSYRNKIRSLQNLGWKHVVMSNKQFTSLSANQQIQNIMGAYLPYMESQLQIIGTKDYYRAEEIQAIKVQDYWDGMMADQAEGYRNNPEQYAKKIQEMAAKQIALSQSIAKTD